ncbi:MAG: hypothetical protein ACFE9S_01835 [Candidatus Hermodarchaeota archaeon]
MPHIVIFAKCPSHVAGKFIDKVVEALQKNLFPDDESQQEALVRSAWKITEDGIKFLSITGVKEGKLEESLKAIYKEMLYYSEIKGFESNVEVWGTWREGFKAIGREIPSI